MENNDNQNLTQKTISGIIWKLAERLGAQIVTLLVSIILARILLPKDYGIVSIVTIVITILNVFVTYGLGTSLIQKKNSDQLDFSTVFYSGIILSLLLYGILFFIAEPIAIFYENEQITWVLRVMGLRLPLAAINSVQQAYVSKKMIFRKFFFATLFGTIISGIVGITMAYNGYGVWSLVAQYLTNVLIDTIVLFIIVKWRPSLVFSFNRLKKLFSYGWKLLVSGLLDTGYNELRSLIIGKKYSTTDLAFYDKGKQFPSLVVTNVNSSISSVLFSAMSRIQDSKEKVKEATRKSIRICSYLIFPCMVGLAAVAEPFVKVVLTDKWLEIVPYLQIMCFVFAFYPVHVANLEALKATGRSDVFLILEVVKKILGISILLATMWFGVFWIAMGMTFTTILSCFINAYPNRKLLNYSYKEQFLDLLPNMFISAIMGILVYFLSYMDSNIYLLLFFQIFVGVTSYIGLSFITKNYSFNYLFMFVKKTMNTIVSKNRNNGNSFYECLMKKEGLLSSYGIDLDDNYVVITKKIKNNEAIIIGIIIDHKFEIKYLKLYNEKKMRKLFDLILNDIYRKYNVTNIVFCLCNESIEQLERLGYKKWN